MTTSYYIEQLTNIRGKILENVRLDKDRFFLQKGNSLGNIKADTGHHKKESLK